jgi:two-component system, chemotaxis family, CheB/CheR fusion protein
VTATDDDVIVRKSLDGRIIYWSDGAARAFGYSREEILGRHVSLIIPFDWQDEEYDMLDRMRLGEGLGTLRTVRRAKDGQLYRVDVTISPIRDAEGKIIGAEKSYRNFMKYKAPPDGERN